MARFRLACPAAAFTHPVLSLNRVDVECQITGGVRKAEGSPCVDSCRYVDCAVWKMAKDLHSQGLGRRAQAMHSPRPHDLGLTRTA